MPKPRYEAQHREAVVFLKPEYKTVTKRAPADFGERAFMVCTRGREGALVPQGVFKDAPIWSSAEGYILLIARRLD
jgi:hypothetical protein